MKKIKTLLFAVMALFGVTLVSLGANAATQSVTYEFDFSGIDSSHKSITDREGKGMEVTCTSHKSGNITGSSILNEVTGPFTKGIKLSSGDTLSFTTKGSWTAELLVSTTSTDSGHTVMINGGAVSDTASTGAANVAFIANLSGDAGAVSIVRSGTKEVDVWQMILTVDEVVGTYHEVTFVDKFNTSKTAATTQTVLEGNKLTAVTNPLRFGKVFNHWENEKGTTVNVSDYTVTKSETLYAVYDDATIYPNDEDALDPDYITSIGGQMGSGTLDEFQHLEPTNFGLSKNMQIVANSVSVGDLTATHVLKSSGAYSFADNTNYVQLYAMSAGTLTIVVANGSTNEAGNTIALYDGVTGEKVKDIVTLPKKDGPYAFQECKITVETGKKEYVIGGTATMLLASVVYDREPVGQRALNLECFVSNELDVVRFVATVPTEPGWSEEDYKELFSMITCTYILTLDEQEVKVNVDYLYTSVAGLGAKTAEDGVFYAVISITGISADYDGKVLKCQAIGVIDGQKDYICSDVIEYTLRSTPTPVTD